MKGKPTMLGIAEIAELAGTSKAAVIDWRKRCRDFPASHSQICARGRCFVKARSARGGSTSAKPRRSLNRIVLWVHPDDVEALRAYAEQKRRERWQKRQAS